MEEEWENERTEDLAWKVGCWREDEDLMEVGGGREKLDAACRYRSISRMEDRDFSIYWDCNGRNLGREGRGEEGFPLCSECEMIG